MDIKALGEGIAALVAVIPAIRDVVKSLPDGSKKAELQSLTDKAERELRIAEAQAATELGYQICRNHPFPGVIMISRGNGVWVCPECGDEMDQFEGYGYGGETPMSR